jgi:predicted secreted Zn-dependent protease
MARSVFALLGGVLALSFGATVPARCDLLISEKIEYYDVTGRTAAEIRASLNRSGPASSLDGRRYDALERATVHWQYTYARSRAGCRIATVAVRLEIVVILPRLVAARGVPKPLISAFARYAAKLKAHETGHVQIEHDIARLIEEGIRKLGPQRTCERLGRAANALGNALVKEGLRLNAEYDARTGQGRTQGVRFP